MMLYVPIHSLQKKIMKTTNSYNQINDKLLDCDCELDGDYSIILKIVRQTIYGLVSALWHLRI